MDPTFRLVIAVIAVFFLASGCQTVKAPAPSTTPEASTESPAPAYFYYLMAQTSLKKGDVNEAVWLMEQAMQHDPESLFLKLETANLLLLLKQDGKALDLLKAVLARDPRHAQALSLAGRILVQQEKTDTAKSYLEKALVQDTPDQNIFLLLGRIYWNEKDWGNALRVFTRYVEKFPDFYAAHYYLGKVQLAQGKWQAAEKSMLKSIELEPALEEPRQELVEIYRAQNRPARVSRLYRDILEQNPANIGAAIDLALHYREIKRPDEAGRLLKDLGRRSLEDEEIITTVYERFLQNKQHETGLWLLNGMLQGAAQSSDLHYLAGVASDGANRPSEALDHFGNVEPGTRFYSNAVVHSALLHHDMGKIDLAIARIEGAIQKQPDTVDYFYYLGTFYEDTERFADALEMFERGLALDDRNLKLHFRRGVIYDKMGRRPESIAAMKRVLSLKPDDAVALNYLGYTYAEMGINLDEAEQLIQTALKLKPEDGYITDSLGWVYYKRGKLDLALDYLNKAVKLVPDDPVILEHLGDVHRKLNSPSKALDYYRRSLEKNPKEKQALEEKIRYLEQ